MIIAWCTAGIAVVIYGLVALAIKAIALTHPSKPLALAGAH